ncbi:MAG: cyclic nucleotide-binding domain-containing protein [Planctomycetota bacterium]
MDGVKIVLRATEVAECPLYSEGDKLVFSLPGVNLLESNAVCAQTVASAYPMVQALAYGVDFEVIGEGQGDEGIFYCPGGVGKRVVFAVKRVKDDREPTLTAVIGKKEKEREEDIQAPAMVLKGFEQDKDVEFIIGHLKKIDLFKPLPMTSIQAIIPALELKRFAESTPIIQQGAPGEYLYILIKGAVEVVQTSEDGIEHNLAQLDRGEVFGEMSLLSREPCSATVRARSNVSVLAVSRENFHKILEEQPSLNIYFNKLLVQRLRRQNVQVDEQISKGVLGKLSMITLPELAQTLNMSRRTGKLLLYNADQRGEIFFQEGQVYDASLGATKGEEAFYSLLELKDGNFRFMEGDVDVDRVVMMDTMGLLMEGLRRLDETTRAN